MIHDAAENNGVTPPSTPGKLSNAVRVLTRLLPLLFEEQAECDEAAAAAALAAGADAAAAAEAVAPYSFAERFFWRNQVPRAAAEGAEAPAAAAAPASAAAAASAAGGGGGGGGAAPSGDAEWEDIDGLAAGEPLGRVLVHAVMSCLFLPEVSVTPDAFWLFSQKLAAIEEQQRARDAAHEAREARRAALAARAAAAARGDAVETQAAIAAQLAAEDAAERAARRRAARAAAGGGGEGEDEGEGEGEQEGEEGEEGEEEEDAGAVLATRSNALWPMLLWKEGVGYPRLLTTAAPAAALANRVDLMRLLLALCSQPLFSAPRAASPPRSRFLDAATGEGCPFAPTLFFSLLNTVLAYDPVGLGVPYAAALLGDREEAPASMAVRLLLVLLDYAPLDAGAAAAAAAEAAAAAAAEAAAAAAAAAPPPPPGPSPPLLPAAAAGAAAAAASPASPASATAASLALTAAPEPVPAPAPAAAPAPKQYNLYRSLLSGLKDEDDLDVLVSAIARLLQTVPAAQLAALPGAYRAIACQHEVLLLLWKLLDENDAFRAHVLQRCDATLLAGPILVAMWGARSAPAQAGLVHLCTFILLLLSGERSFGVGLNAKVETRLPADMPLFSGSFADLLVITLHKLVVDGSPRLSSLYSCFLTIIGNVSPYAKGLGLIAAAKLVNLIELFSSPSFLFARPNNFVFAHQLLETLNNLLQYQFESNAVLVYSVLRRREVFERLAGASVSQWREELARAAAAAGGKGGAGAAPAGAAAGGSVRRPPPRSAGAGAGPSSAGAGAGAVAGAGGAGGAWAATDEWAQEMLRELPLLTVQRLLGYLGPLLEEFLRRQEGIVDDEAVVAFVRSTTVVGVLPVPHAILVRSYVPNAFTTLWASTFLWSTVFLGLSEQDLPLFDAEAIRLFSIVAA